MEERQAYDLDLRNNAVYHRLCNRVNLTSYAILLISFQSNRHCVKRSNEGQIRN